MRAHRSRGRTWGGPGSGARGVTKLSPRRRASPRPTVPHGASPRLMASGGGADGGRAAPTGVCRR